MKILNFPEFRQVFEYDCGATAMHAVLSYYGIDIPESKIMKIAGTKSWRGTPVKGFAKVAKKFKLRCITRTITISDIKKYIDRKIPVILLLQAWPGKKIKDWKKAWKDGHYVVAIGYDKNKIYFEDPASIFRTYLSYKELEERWHDIAPFTRKRYFNLGIIFIGRKNSYHPKKIIHMD